MSATDDELNRLSELIIGAGMVVHRELGPGLLESAHEACLEFELRDRGHHVERQVPLPVVYRSMQMEAGFRIDLLVDHLVIVELKAVESFEKIHEAQLHTYLRLTGLNLGLLLNFNTVRLTDGIKRVVRNFPKFLLLLSSCLSPRPHVPSAVNGISLHFANPSRVKSFAVNVGFSTTSRK